MTTVATDGKSMSGEGRVSNGDRIEADDCVKVRRLTGGRLAGVCGDAYNYEPFFKWLTDGGDFPEPDGGFGGLTLDPDGAIRTWDAKGRSFLENGPAATRAYRQSGRLSWPASATCGRAV